jgi:hypothetical protein
MSLKKIWIPLFILFFSPFIIFSQTITSKPTGGSWNDANTWVGGVVPNQNNDVIIKGVVSATENATCKNITVTDTLQAISWPAAKLIVTGDIVNNGLIRDYESYYWNNLFIYVAGSITNNGIFRNVNTCFNSITEHRLSQGAGKTFETLFTAVDTLGSYKALSSLSFKKSFNLKGASLNMQNYSLTLETAGNIYNGSVINTGDLIGKGGASISSITYKGNINLKSIVTISTDVTFEGTVIVADTLNVISWPPVQALTIKGDIINKGLISNYEGYYGQPLYVYISGNLTNNGIWRNSSTYFIGVNEHKISLGTGKIFETNFAAVDTLATFTAISPLYFKGSFNLKGGSLNMQLNSLTLEASGNIFNGFVTNTKDLTGKAGAALSSITYKGNLNLKSIVTVSTDVTFEGTVTITDTLTVISWPLVPALTIKGDITNNGLVCNYEGYYGKPLYVYLSGNITNNGIWRNTKTYFTGVNEHKISLGTGKIFETNLAAVDTLGKYIAISPLYFKGSFELKGATLNMQSNSLTLYGNGNISDGLVTNTGDLIGKGNAALSNITYNGNINIKGIIIISSNVNFIGNVTITDTLQAIEYPEVPVFSINGDVVNNGLIRNYEGYYGKALNLYATGDFVNNGILRNSNNYLSGTLINNGSINNNIYSSGDITNYGKWESGNVYFTGSGQRTILGNGISAQIHSKGEKVIFVGENYLPNLVIDSKSVCSSSSGSNIYVPDNTIDENLDNGGSITIKKKFSTATDYSFFKSRIKVLSNNSIDSVIVSSYGKQVPQSFANAVRCYWRIATFSKTSFQSFSSLTLLYDHTLLGNNSESGLQVYNSQDSGKTWVQVSTSLNTTRDITNNSITLTDAPAKGDYLLSSSADPVSVRPSIVTAVIGRTGIRIGVPSRLTIHFVNNSDLIAEDFIIAINTGSKVHVHSVEIPLSDDSKLVLPKDSLFYDNSEDTSAFFYVLKMAPREERTFDINVVGDQPTGKYLSANKILFEPVTITAAAIITWTAWKAGTYVVTKSIDYLGDKAVENIKMTSDEQKRYDDMVKGGIPTELEKQPGSAKVFAGKFVGGQITKKLLTLAPAGESAFNIAATTTQNIKKVAPSLRQRIFNWLYKESGLYGVEETQNGNTYQPAVSTATQKKGQLVRSWDPNEKVGPEGFGDKKFITSAGKMMYQILFENKKEATAAAYKIVIIDTLKPEFNPETVEFGKTSHDAAQYKWKKTRTGNILKWEIEGIELPPNVNPPEGEGWVAFTVSPLNSISSGTELKNSATITFDANPPITTNTYLNILDFKAPTTQMKPLTQKFKGKNLVIKWQSTDDINGSGVESVTLYASIDGGAYNVFGTTNEDSLQVTLATGVHKYSFYALGKDYIGNVESIRPAIIGTESTNGIEQIENKPAKYSLSQNYPNPFNPVTTIEFSIPKTDNVTIKIYNVLGQEIKTLINGKMDAGTYKAEWQANNNSSGIYFYQMKAGDFSSTKKLILLK